MSRLHVFSPFLLPLLFVACGPSQVEEEPQEERPVVTQLTMREVDTERIQPASESQIGAIELKEDRSIEVLFVTTSEDRENTSFAAGLISGVNQVAIWALEGDPPAKVYAMNAPASRYTPHLPGNSPGTPEMAHDGYWHVEQYILREMYKE